MYWGPEGSTEAHLNLRETVHSPRASATRTLYTTTSRPDSAAISATTTCMPSGTYISCPVVLTPIAQAD